MFDFANSSYTTVVTTAIFNAYFVKTVCQHLPLQRATFFLTLAVGIANFIVVATAPVVGAIADVYVLKKRFLAVATIVCVICTALLATVHTGDVISGMIFLIAASFAFGTSENLIAVFCPKLPHPIRWAASRPSAGRSATWAGSFVWQFVWPMYRTPKNSARGQASLCR